MKLRRTDSKVLKAVTYQFSTRKKTANFARALKLSLYFKQNNKWSPSANQK